jgi:hypothetical protein
VPPTTILTKSGTKKINERQPKPSRKPENELHKPKTDAGGRNETRVNWRRAMAKLIEQNDYRLLSHEAGSGASWTGIKTKSLGTQSPAEKISPWQLGAATKSKTRNEDRGTRRATWPGTRSAGRLVLWR